MENDTKMSNDFFFQSRLLNYRTDLKMFTKAMNILEKNL